MINQDENNGELIGKARDFAEKINTLKMQFFSALDDFKKYYVFFNKNPEVDEYQNYYANSKGQLQTMSREVFLTTNGIDKMIENLNSQMSTIADEIRREKELNIILTQKLKHLQNTENGSEILVDDSKTEYNIQYYKNWEMYFGVVMVVTLIYKVYKFPTASINK